MHFSGILRFHRRRDGLGGEPGIVRVGGRSKSEEMRTYSIADLKRKLREQRRVPRGIFVEGKEIRDDLDKKRGQQIST